jgi:hypothetical protein
LERRDGHLHHESADLHHWTRRSAPLDTSTCTIECEDPHRGVITVHRRTVDPDHGIRDLHTGSTNTHHPTR